MRRVCQRGDGERRLDTQHHVEAIVNLFAEELAGNLAGIYLHGSLAMGCFNPQKSDIDVIVVAEEPLAAVQKQRIARKLLSVDDQLLNEQGIEVSIILESALTDFVHPAPCEFHYSAYHREKYRADEQYICGGFADPDLAAHLVVTCQRGRTLFGRPIRDVFPEIPRQYYIDAILHDVKDARQDIIDSPVYIALNLCRVLLFLKEGIVSSKKEAGEWAVKAVPLAYQALVERCLQEYIEDQEKGKIDVDKITLVSFADHMLHEISKYLPQGGNVG